MSNHDNEKAKMAALLAGLEDILAGSKAREKQEMETGKCADCGGDLAVFWPEGQADRGEPIFVCWACHQREGE